MVQTVDLNLFRFYLTIFGYFIVGLLFPMDAARLQISFEGTGSSCALYKRKDSNVNIKRLNRSYGWWEFRRFAVKMFKFTTSSSKKFNFEKCLCWYGNKSQDFSSPCSNSHWNTKNLESILFRPNFGAVLSEHWKGLVEPKRENFTFEDKGLKNTSDSLIFLVSIVSPNYGTKKFHKMFRHRWNELFF